MRLYLLGSENRYSLEQLAIVLFPQKKPVVMPVPDGRKLLGDGDCAVCTVRRHPGCVTASVRMRLDGRRANGTASARISNETSARAYNILEKQTIKRSFYRAAVRLLPQTPPWGALSGVRPAKLARFMMEGGLTPRGTFSELKSRYFVSPEKAGLCVRAAGQAAAVKKTLGTRDISLYVGIPFCPTRCVYCSFVSRAVGRSAELIAPYLDALCREIKQTARLVEPLGLRVRTVYIGGGTPTTLAAPQLSRLFAALRESFGLDGMTEFTVEAGRPDTIDREKLEVIRDAGATRLSVNPQTMNDAVLARVGRAHTAADTERAFALARSLGFDCINMDLIAGLPGDGPESFADTLARVLALRPENITVHTLALKRGSALHEHPEELPDVEQLTRMLGTADGMLTRAGFLPYYLYRQKYMTGSLENVGWSLPGREGIYNICMMEELQTILAFGAGSVTKLVSPDEETIERVTNHKYPQEYLRDIDRQIEAKRAVTEFYARHGIG